MEQYFSQPKTGFFFLFFFTIGQNISFLQYSSLHVADRKLNSSTNTNID